MRRHHEVGHLLACLAAPLILLSIGTVSAGTYIEDFTTKQYCDTVNTAAWWDTVAGEIRLPPFRITLAGSLDTPGSACGVAVAGEHAFVADGASGFHVIDISDPSNPDFVGTYDTPGNAYGVAISGDYAYVADRVAGLVVVAISNPATPSHAGSYNTQGNAYAVAVSGDYAYVADYGSGLLVLDVIDPTNPDSAGSYDTPGSAYGIALSGDYAYVADGGSGLLVIDISDPTSPDSAGSFDLPGIARGVALSGDYAYVAAGNAGLKVLDISDPTTPALVASYETPGTADDVTIAGNWVYVADRSSGVQVVDVRDPANPTYAGDLDTPGQSLDLTLSGDYAYVADEASGLRVISITEQMLPPRFAGSDDTPDNACRVMVAGDYAYVADEGLGLQILDVSDPANPVHAATHDTPGSAEDVAIAGDYAFVADRAGGLQVVDISDPTGPSSAGDYVSGDVSSIAVAGDHAYVTSAYNFWTIDISDPANPQRVGEYTYSEKLWDVAVSGNYAYLAVKSDALVVINISDPTNPTFAGQAFAGGGGCVAVSGDYLYMAVSTDFLVIDISDPSSPTQMGACVPPDRIEGIAVYGDYALCAARDSGLVILDISDPVAPTFVTGYDTPGYSKGLTHAGDYTYVADGSSGLQVIETFQRKCDHVSNVAYSTDLEPDSTVYGIRLSATQTDSIKWEVSADSGTHWQDILPGPHLQPLIHAGDHLVWRSHHYYTQVGATPRCSHLEIEYNSDLSWLGVVLSDSLVDFGAVTTGEGHSRRMTIFNYLPDPVQIYGVSLEGDVFATDISITELSGRSSHSFNVSFFSWQNLDYTDFLALDISVGDEPLVARLSAEAHHPGTYYDATRNLCGEELKTVLHELIDEHTVLDYTTARDNMYGHIDNYACGECPDTGCVECVYTGRVACFNTRIGAGEHGFNCEHTWPQSLFCSASPMVSDIFHLYPTDATANSRRGNYDFGIVVSPTWSEGGSKLGDDADGLLVFEPRDQHKGNVARTHFYFIVRYAASRRESCNSYDDPAKMEAHLRDWHYFDPVDAAEQQRNEDIYALQHNRNPFIDHPEFVERISSFFGTAACLTEPEIAVSPGQVDLGVIGFDSTAHYDIAVINSGDDTLTVSSISSTNPNFDVGTTSLAVAPGTYEHVTVSYTSGIIDLSDTTDILITSNDSDEGLVTVPVTVEVDGTSGLTWGGDIPLYFSLFPNYPNPFRGVTSIKYGLPWSAHVEISIYNVLGRKVRTLLDGWQPPGYAIARWDGRDHYGNQAASGIYFVRFEAGDFACTRKMILLR